MLLKCSNHFGELAGWRCTACRATLCAACTGVRVSGTARLEICSRCGAFATPIRVPRGELHPFSAGQLVSALRWPLNKLGLLSIFASAALITAFGVFGAKAAAIAVGVTVSYLFQIVRHTAHGKDDVPGPEDFQGYIEDVVGPWWRITLALAWIWAPALAWTLWQGSSAPALDPAEQQVRAVQHALEPGGPGIRVHGMRAVASPTGIEVIEASAQPPPVRREEAELRAGAAADEEADPEERQEENAAVAAAPPPPAPRGPLVPLLLVALGVLVAPMSLIASSLKTPLRIAANPVVLAGCAVKLGRDYLLLVAFCLCGVAAAFALQAATHLVAGTGFLSRLPANFATVAVAFVTFRGIGLLVRARGGDLGYGSDELYLVNVLGDAEPACLPREALPVEDPCSHGATAASAPESPGQALARLVAHDDVDGLVALLERSGKDVPHGALAAAAWMDLAHHAWKRRKGKAAAVALRRCLDAEPDGPLAPRAWFLAARVYAEALGDPKTSDRLLRELVQRFPESDAGRAAARRLADAT